MRLVRRWILQAKACAHQRAKSRERLFVPIDSRRVNCCLHLYLQQDTLEQDSNLRSGPLPGTDHRIRMIAVRVFMYIS